MLYIESGTLANIIGGSGYDEVWAFSRVKYRIRSMCVTIEPRANIGVMDIADG